MKSKDLYLVVNQYAVEITQLDKFGMRGKRWHMYIDGKHLTDFSTKAEAIKYAKTEIYR